MNVKIENYRGFDIMFETDSERFSFSLDKGSWKEKQSYAACKKNIDDFIKENQNFTPFFVINKNGSKVKIIAIRKDKRFVSESVRGNEQFYEYEEERYYLYEEKYEEIINNIKKLENQISEKHKEISIEQAKIAGKTLREYKNEKFPNL